MINNQQIDPIAQKLNKLLVKFNAKAMLEQETSEALSEYINLVTGEMVKLKAENEALKVELAKYKPKEEKKVK